MDLSTTAVNVNPAETRRTAFQSRLYAARISLSFCGDGASLGHPMRSTP